MARRLPSNRNQRERLSKCFTVCFGTQLIGLHSVKSLSPCLSNFIQAMSSPTHSTFQPGSVGQSMARFVFPQALGNAAAMYFLSPAGLVMPRIWEIIGFKVDRHVHRESQADRASGSLFWNILVWFLTSMCSASQPSSLARREAMRSAKHFFPSREFPPYPLPNETICLRSGIWAMSVWSGLQGQLFTKGSERQSSQVDLMATIQKC